MESKVHLIDCVEFMRGLPDKAFDLAIVDPPYGIGMGCTLNTNSRVNFKDKYWDDKIPNDDYFIELFRISNNQIIWGGNYFPFLWNNPCKDFIFWNKLNHHYNRSDGEMAWTSFDGLCKYFEYMWDGNRYGYKNKIKGVGQKTIRIHPTEKPIELYRWLLRNYAKPNDTIFDSHMGSQSSRIACHMEGFDFTGCELDPEYFEQGNARYEAFLKTYGTPDPTQAIKGQQINLF